MKEKKFRAWDGETMNSWMKISEDGTITNWCLPAEKLIWMQYSGLNDKHEVELYEGDIIKYISFDGKEYIVPVPDLSHFHWWSEMEELEFEILGNIYGNPNLKTDIPILND